MAQTTGNGMDRFFKSFLLTLFSILLIFVFSHFGTNKLFFSQKIPAYWDAFVAEKAADLSTEEIKKQRYGAQYVVSLMIKDYFEKNKIKDPVVLLEPNDYLQKTAGFKMPEPIVFYYFTGLHALWLNSSNVEDATYMVYITQRGLRFQPITSKEQLQSILNQYKQYKPSL